MTPPLLRPATFVGTKLFDPPGFNNLPQQFTVPPDSNAHEESAPATTAVAPLKPETATGVDEAVVVPFPSWPLTLRPQHDAAPPANTAQECEL
jgi:hypothetical protein